MDLGDDQAIDDVLSQYSDRNKTTQLKMALADISGRRGTWHGSNKRLSQKQSLEVVAKRRKLMNATSNDQWVPGQLQPFGYHVMSPSLFSKKKRHLRQSTFQKVMGMGKRSVSVRTDTFASNWVSVSKGRKVSHGRYTLARGKVSAKQKHLMMDIKAKHRERK